MRLAHHQHKSLQECLEGTTSTEFIDWIVMRERMEKEVSKEDFYAAQIAAEIRQFREMFAKNPKSINIKDLFIDFDKEPEEKEPKVVKDSPDTIESLPEPEKERPKEKEIEIGPDVLDNPKWAEVTRLAKAAWFGMFGATSEEELNQPTQEQLDEFKKQGDLIHENQLKEKRRKGGN